jgi:dolichol-phosphate mannosyltransferase
MPGETHQEFAAHSLVVIPTYNECENAAAIITAVLAATSTNNHVLVVDDNSPDGTADIVRGLINQGGVVNPRLHLLSRPGKQGLGRAYIAAFKWALEKGYGFVVEMDADFSHRPQDLVRILSAIRDPKKVVDFAVGSRYVPGGSTVNWGILRKIISRGGSLYTRIILGFPLSDWTGGFNAWSQKVLRGIDLDQVRSEGYSFQIELKYRSLKRGFVGVEVPITFEDRRVGKSKMSLKIVLEAFTRVWGMKFG